MTGHGQLAADAGEVRCLRDRRASRLPGAGESRTTTSRADLIFANAALQWVGDHPAIFPKLAALVNPGGVLAMQMPFSHVQPIAPS